MVLLSAFPALGYAWADKLLVSGTVTQDIATSTLCHDTFICVWLSCWPTISHDNNDKVRMSASLIPRLPGALESLVLFLHVI